MKELLKKKSVKISLLLIILLVIMGIIGINVQSAQRQREYDEHIATAEKYLTELDYEQAIAEYTLAFEIDPKEEVVDALEQTYLAYAQSCIDAGDYEKAVSILEEGYEKTGRESLQNKIEEFQIMQEEIRVKEAELQEQIQLEEEQRASGMVEFPFQGTDITVMGYDLSEDRFEEMRGLFPTGEGYFMENTGTDTVFQEWGIDPIDGYYYINNRTYDNGSGESKELYVHDSSGNSWSYTTYYYPTTDAQANSAGLSLGCSGDGQVPDYEGVHVPLKAGETYEDWCRVMQIDRMKENDLRPEEHDGTVSIRKEDGSALFTIGPVEGREFWLFSSEGYQGMYTEGGSGDGFRYCELYFVTESPRTREQSLERIIAHIGANGVIYNITYYFRL